MGKHRRISAAPLNPRAAAASSGGRNTAARRAGGWGPSTGASNAAGIHSPNWPFSPYPIGVRSRRLRREHPLRPSGLQGVAAGERVFVRRGAHFFCAGWRSGESRGLALAETSYRWVKDWPLGSGSALQTPPVSDSPCQSSLRKPLQRERFDGSVQALEREVGFELQTLQPLAGGGVEHGAGAVPGGRALNPAQAASSRMRSCDLAWVQVGTVALDVVVGDRVAPVVELFELALARRVAGLQLRQGRGGARAPRGEGWGWHRSNATQRLGRLSRSSLSQSQNPCKPIQKLSATTTRKARA
jgi:hypothetical protein